MNSYFIFNNTPFIQTNNQFFQRIGILLFIEYIFHKTKSEYQIKWTSKMINEYCFAMLKSIDGNIIDRNECYVWDQFILGSFDETVYL